MIGGHGRSRRMAPGRHSNAKFSAACMETIWNFIATTHLHGLQHARTLAALAQIFLAVLRSRLSPIRGRTSPTRRQLSALLHSGTPFLINGASEATTSMGQPTPPW